MGHELIPYLLQSAPNLSTLLVHLDAHHESSKSSTFSIEDLKRWLAPRRDGIIPASHLKVLQVKVMTPWYDSGTRSQVLKSVNTILLARRRAGAGRSLNITISREDYPGVQLRWEDGRLVFPFGAPPEDTRCQSVRLRHAISSG
jgi:hypothetical protein